MNATPVLTTENLTPADCRVLSVALGIPPTHTVDQFAASFPDLAVVWHQLRHTTSVPVMIACAALRGRVQRLTPDPRLNPKPHAPLQHAPPKTPGTPATPRRSPPTKPAWAQDNAVLVAVVPNPKKPGSTSYERFKNYVVGRTVAEILAAGSTRGDLSWDGQRDFVTFRLPEEP